jgi:hypothetical protein
VGVVQAEIVQVMTHDVTSLIGKLLRQAEGTPYEGERQAFMPLATTCVRGTSLPCRGTWRRLPLRRLRNRCLSGSWDPSLRMWERQQTFTVPRGAPAGRLRYAAIGLSRESMPLAGLLPSTRHSWRSSASAYPGPFVAQAGG